MSTFRRVLAPLALALGGSALYLLTAAPTVAGTDAGELVLAAYSRGVAHAPGFPTWLIPASLVVRLPVGEPAWRLNAFSALMAALTLVVLWAWLRQMPLPLPVTETAHPRRGDRKGARPAAPAPAIDLPLLIAATFGVSRSFWPWATTTEVYTLNALLACLSLFFLFRWSESPAPPRRLWASPLVAAALCFGLALGAHLATTGLLAPAIALWLIWHRQRLSPALVALCVLALLLGMATYAVLPLRAAAHPALNWGDPETWQGFWRQVTAAQYRSNLSLDPAALASGLRFGSGLTLSQFSLLGLPLVAWGVWWGWRQQRRLTLFVLVGFLTSVLYALAYQIEDDGDAYYILAHLLLTVPLMWGVQALALAVAGRVKVRTGSYPRWPWLLLWLLPLLTFAFNLGLANRREYWYHRDYYRNLTAEVAAGGTIFTRDWQFYSPSLYYQHVLADRPDLHIIDLELMRRGWYLDQLEQWYPDLTHPAAAELAAYRRLRDAWEANPKGFEADAQGVASLQAAYVGAINALIRAASARGEVRLSHEQEQGVGADETWTPAGLTFRLAAAGEGPLPPLAWDVSHLAGRWTRLPDDPARKVARVHALMAQNRAIYLARLGDRAGALAALELAGQIDPTNTLVPQLRQQLGG